MRSDCAGMLAVILRESSLSGPSVLVLLFALATVAMAGLSRGVWRAASAKVFWGFIALLVVAWASSVVFWPRTLDGISGEGHVIEWTTSHLLLVAAAVGLVTMLRLRREGRSSPITMLLTVGCFAGFFRELEWGQPFVGEKYLYTRYMFRPRAWFDPERLHGPAEDTGLSTEMLHTSMMVFLGVVIVVAVVLVVYFHRRREVFHRQLREFIHTLWGRLFLVGCGLYVAALLLCRVTDKIFEAWMEANGVSSCIIAEPLELIGAIFFAGSMLALWHGQLSASPVQSAGVGGQAQLAAAATAPGEDQHVPSD